MIDEGRIDLSATISLSNVCLSGADVGFNIVGIESPRPGANMVGVDSPMPGANRRLATKKGINQPVLLFRC